MKKIFTTHHRFISYQDTLLIEGIPFQTECVITKKGHFVGVIILN